MKASYRTIKDFYYESIPNNDLDQKRSYDRLNLKWEIQNYMNPTDPAVWGPAFWFSLHVGSTKYPINASKIVADRMKGFILGLPYMLPCENCAEHARAYIDSNYHNLDNICSGRHNLFCFWVDFHNYVNIRYGKPEISCEDAYNMYTGYTTVKKLSYSSS